MNDYKVSSWFHVVLLALAFAVVSAPAFAIDVVLKVDVAANELAIVSSGKKCQGTRKNCIGPAKGSSPFINFRLPNACGDNDEDPKFQLNGMQLSMVKRTRAGKAFGLYALPNIVATDFKASAASGWVDLGPPNIKKADHLKVKDENSGEYVVFYRIEAIPCGAAGASIWLDPRIENPGN
jgi:hypothetical protein